MCDISGKKSTLLVDGYISIKVRRLKSCCPPILASVYRMLLLPKRVDRFQTNFVCGHTFTIFPDFLNFFYIKKHKITISKKSAITILIKYCSSLGSKDPKKIIGRYFSTKKKKNAGSRVISIKIPNFSKSVMPISFKFE